MSSHIAWLESRTPESPAALIECIRKVFVEHPEYEKLHRVDAFVDALAAHSRFVGAKRIVWPRFARHRALGAEVRARLGPDGRLRA